MSALVGYGGRPAWPGTDENLEQVIATLKMIADPTDDGHQEAKTWLYAQMATGIVKKVVVSAGEGLLGINIGNLEDWKTGIPAADALGVPLTGASMFMGMMDTQVTGQQVGDMLPGFRSAGDARPAYYALQLVNEMLEGFTSVEKLDLGAGVWAYRFNLPEGPLWVLWYDDGILYFPGETPATVEIELPFDGSTALVTQTPVVLGRSEVDSTTISSSQGILPLNLGPEPIFVEVGQ